MAAPDGSAWPIKFKTGSKLGVFKKRKEVNDAKKDRSVHEKTRKEVDAISIPGTSREICKGHNWFKYREPDGEGR
jgi:hypothetical protein